MIEACKPNVTNPSIANATSVTLLSANAKRLGVEIQNNAAFDIAVSPAGIVMTGITPTAAKPCIVIRSGQSWWTNDTFVSQSAFTVYQTSGSATELVTVIEGFTS